MFKFSLVDREHIRFSWNIAQISRQNDNLCIREAKLDQVKIGEIGHSNSFSEFRDMMHSESLPHNEGFSNTINMWELTASIGIYIRSEKHKNYIKIWSTGKDDVLTRLKQVMQNFGLEIKLMVEFNSFAIGRYDIEVMTKEFDLSDFFKYNRNDIYVRLYSGNWSKVMWNHIQEKHDFSAIISIKCTAFCPRICALNILESHSTIGRKPFSLEKMLDEGLNSDMQIIASDGEMVKCHKFVLIEQSKVFEAMFKEASQSKEAISGTIQMDDMTSESVKAFLAFLYLESVDDARKDCTIALELFKAAYKYDIPRLQMNLQQILLTKPYKWFGIEVAIQLYFFAKNISEVEAIEAKAARILKFMYSDLDESPTYNQLFKDNPTAAKELCRALLRLS